MELHFLGTASGFPSPRRGASGLVLKNQLTGAQWLFDCGEGTQITAQKSDKIKLGKLTRIFISHTHGDHMYGLPGLLCTVSQKFSTLLGATSEDDKPVPNVEIYGPEGLRRFLRIALGLSHTRLQFKYTVHELILDDNHKPAGFRSMVSTKIDSILDPPLPCEIVGNDFKAVDGFWKCVSEEDGFQIHAYALKHTIPSVGWLIVEPNKLPKLNAAKAALLGVPKGPLLAQLKQGQDVTLEDNTVVKAGDVLEDSNIRGRRIAILGDSYDSDELIRLSRSLDIDTVDVIVHEATFDDSFKEEAISKGHSTPRYVTNLAAKLETTLVVLTHFSHRYQPIENDEEVLDSSGRPTLQILLNDSLKNKEYKGKVILADDLAVIDIPKI